MITISHSNALVTLLGLGAADLALLNLWAIPALLTVTDVSSARDAPAVESRARDAPAVAILGSDAPPRLDERTGKTGLQPSPAGELERAEVQTNETGPPAVVRFSSGTWWVGRGGRRALRESLERISQSADVVEVRGHADRAGSETVNQRISEERARAVAELLVQSGVDRSRIRLRAYGESAPAAAGNNRRVEIVMRGAQ